MRVFFIERRGVKKQKTVLEYEILIQSNTKFATKL